jgi:hypothetical protein
MTLVCTHAVIQFNVCTVSLHFGFDASVLAGNISGNPEYLQMQILKQSMSITSKNVVKITVA